MSTGVRRILATMLATALMLAVVWLLVSHDQAQAQVDQTCNDIGDFENLTSSTSGTWGSVTFSDTEPTLTLVVEAGFEVRLCVKAGSAQQGNGPELTEWFGAGTHEVAHSSGKELSHYGIEFRSVTTTTEPEEDPTTTVGETTTTEQETTTTSDITTTTTTEESSTTTTPEEETTTTTTGISTTTAPGTSTTAPSGSSTSVPAGSTTVPGERPTTSFDPCVTRFEDECFETSTTDGPGVLPFTGGIDPKVAAAGIVVSLGGLIALALAGRLKPEEDES